MNLGILRSGNYDHEKIRDGQAVEALHEVHCYLGKCELDDMVQGALLSLNSGGAK